MTNTCLSRQKTSFVATKTKTKKQKKKSRELFVEKNVCDKSVAAPANDIIPTLHVETRVCRDKTFVTSILLSLQKSVLSLQTCVCRDKNMLVGTNVLSRQKAKHLSRQK